MYDNFLLLDNEILNHKKSYLNINDIQKQSKNYYITNNKIYILNIDNQIIKIELPTIQIIDNRYAHYLINIYIDYTKIYRYWFRYSDIKQMKTKLDYYCYQKTYYIYDMIQKYKKLYRCLDIQYLIHKSYLFLLLIKSLLEETNDIELFLLKLEIKYNNSCFIC